MATNEYEQVLQQAKNLSPQEVRRLIEQLQESLTAESDSAGGFQRLAELADQWDFHSDDPELADRLNDLLKGTFTDDLLNQMNDTRAP